MFLQVVPQFVQLRAALIFAVTISSDSGLGLAFRTFLECLFELLHGIVLSSERVAAR